MATDSIQSERRKVDPYGLSSNPQLKHNIQVHEQGRALSSTERQERTERDIPQPRRSEAGRG